MAFFSNSPAVFFVTKGGIGYFGGGGKTILHLALGPEMVSNQEVVDGEKVGNAIGNFLRQTALKERSGLVILGDDVVFQKTVPAAGGKEEEDRFFDRVPFDSEKLVRKIVKNGSEEILLGANRELFGILEEKMAARGMRVLAVVPAGLLGVSGRDSLTVADLQKILAQKNNFWLGDMREFGGGGTAGKEQFGGRRVYLLVAGLAGAIILALAIWFLNLGGKIGEGDHQNKGLSGTGSFLITTLPSPSMIQKTIIKGKIVVASSSAGAASKVRDKLSELGVGSIEIETAGQGESSGGAKVQFSKAVDAGLAKRIYEGLTEILGKVATGSAGVTGVDVQVSL